MTTGISEITELHVGPQTIAAGTSLVLAVIAEQLKVYSIDVLHGTRFCHS